MEVNPKEAAYIYARANANYRKGEWTAAAADFDRAAELDPKIENIEYLRGYAHRAAGILKKPERSWRSLWPLIRIMLTRFPASAMWRLSRVGSMKPKRH